MSTKTKTYTRTRLRVAQIALESYRADLGRPARAGIPHMLATEFDCSNEHLRAQAQLELIVELLAREVEALS